MHILVVNGSPKKKGTISQLINYLIEDLPTNTRVDMLFSAEMNIAPCKGCYVCTQRSGCVIQDDMQNFYDLIQLADVIVVGSPVYWGNMSGSLKMLFDRCLGVFEDLSGSIPRGKLSGKKAIIITACNAPWPFNIFGQSRTACNAIKTVLKSAGIHIIASINNAGTFNRKTKTRNLSISAVKKVKRSFHTTF